MAKYSERTSGKLDFRDLGIPPGPEHDCPYLEGRAAAERAFRLQEAPEGLYKHLMDFGWRRSGSIVYKPACSGCAECVPIRVPVREFVPNRSQRRSLKRNADIEARVGVPRSTTEKFDLFVRYQRGRHTGEMCTLRGEFEQFLYRSPVRTIEVEFRIDGRLVGAAIADRDGGALSAVYTWFDPDLDDRGLGTWSILWFIDYARGEGIPYYYMGYLVRDCRKMNYKSNFRPYEIGDSGGRWTRAEADKS